MQAHPLKLFRDERGWTQRDLAARAQTSVATVSRIEAGLARPSLALIARLVEATGGAVGADAIVRAAVEPAGPGAPPASAE